MRSVELQPEEVSSKQKNVPSKAKEKGRSVERLGGLGLAWCALSQGAGPCYGCAKHFRPLAL